MLAYIYVKIVATVVRHAFTSSSVLAIGNCYCQAQGQYNDLTGAIQAKQKYAPVADMLQVPGTHLSILTLSWSFGLYILLVSEQFKSPVEHGRSYHISGFAVTVKL